MLYEKNVSEIDSICKMDPYPLCLSRTNYGRSETVPQRITYASSRAPTSAAREERGGGLLGLRHGLVSDLGHPSRLLRKRSPRERAANRILTQRLSQSSELQFTRFSGLRILPERSWTMKTSVVAAHPSSATTATSRPLPVDTNEGLRLLADCREEKYRGVVRELDRVAEFCRYCEGFQNIA